MPIENDKYTKVLFRYFSNILNKEIVETMWATIVDNEKGIYKLDSIPFYGPQIATEDEFYADFDKNEQMLSYRETTKYSGNSIVLVTINQNDYDKEKMRDEFRILNCTSEGLNEHYFALEIPKRCDYSIIKNKLSELETRGIIEYAEPCLSEKHRNDIIKFV